MEYLPLYSAEQARRHDVKPGITEWAQFNGRNALSWQERLKLDVWYVDHHSLMVGKVFKGEGISQEGRATVERFKGT